MARDAGCLVAYLPGLTMRRIADLYPNEVKTDARDAFIIAEATRTSNRMRGLLTAIHPHLERVIGPRIRHPAILNLLEHYGSPAAIQSAGLEEITEVLRAGAPRMAGRLATDILAALDDQTVVVPGTNSAAIILPSLAASLRTVLDQHRNSPPTSRSC